MAVLDVSVLIPVASGADLNICYFIFDRVDSASRMNIYVAVQTGDLCYNSVVALCVRLVDVAVADGAGGELRPLLFICVSRDVGYAAVTDRTVQLSVRCLGKVFLKLRSGMT